MAALGLPPKAQGCSRIAGLPHAAAARRPSARHKQKRSTTQHNPTMRRATSAKRATQRLRRTVKKPLDMKTQDKLRKALRAKCGSRPDERFFRKYDRDRSGELSVQEVEEMFRTGLKITKREASPADVRALVAAMDADGSGTLSLAELAAFVGNRPVSPGKSKMKRRMIKKTTAFFPSSNANEPLAPPYRMLPASIQHGHVDAGLTQAARTRTSTPRP